MAKLVKNADGSVSLVHEEGSEELAKYETEKLSHNNIKNIKKLKKDFKSLSQAEKDLLLEHLLRIHDLI